MIMERYQRLFLDEKQRYIASSNIIISASALLKDNEKNTILGQVKFQNVGNKVVSALIVTVLCYDVLGNELEKISYQYLDLNVKRDEFFGSQKPIPISNFNVRKMDVLLERIIYADGTESIIEKSGSIVVPNLDILSADEEILKQAQIEFGKAAKYKYMELSNLWFCTCGMINSVEEKQCHSCGVAKNNLEGISIENLIENKEQRLAKELAEEEEKRKICEEEKKKRQERTKRRVKNLAIACAIALFVGLAGILFKYIYTNHVVPNSKYEKAEEFIENGDYDSAIGIYRSLNGYKDSEKKLYETYYAKANVCYKEGKHDEALELYEFVSEQKNVEQEIYDCKNEKAIKLYEEAVFEEAYSIFLEIGNEEYIAKIESVYLEQKKEAGKKQLEELVNLSAYRDKEQTTINSGITDGKGRIDRATTQKEIDDIINEYRTTFAGIKTAAQYEEESKVNTANNNTASQSGRTIDDSLLYGSWKCGSESGNYIIITYNGNNGSYILYSEDGSVLDSTIGNVRWTEGNWLIITGQRTFFGEDWGIHECWIEIEQLTSTSFYFSMQGYFYKL